MNMMIEKVGKGLLDIVIKKLQDEIPFGEVERTEDGIAIYIDGKDLSDALEKEIQKSVGIPLSGALSVSIENNKLCFKIKVI